MICPWQHYGPWPAGRSVFRSCEAGLTILMLSGRWAYRRMSVNMSGPEIAARAQILQVVQRDRLRLPRRKLAHRRPEPLQLHRNRIALRHVARPAAGQPCVSPNLGTDPPQPRPRQVHRHLPNHPSGRDRPPSHRASARRNASCAISSACGHDPDSTYANPTTGP